MSNPQKPRHVTNGISRRALIGGATVLGVGVIAARIGYVNATASWIPTVHHQPGETFDMSGCYLADSSYEPTEGLSIQLKSAELLSYNEWIEKYATDGTQPSEGLDIKSIVNLEVTFTNSGDNIRTFYVFEAKLIPARRNDYLLFDGALWANSGIPVDALTSFVSFNNDSKPFTTNIPYTINDYGGTTRYETPMEDRTFEWVVSMGPERHVFDIEL